ncbi:MAG: hypothetical protein Q4C54_09000 [Clostridia bacterium]|nr:hypothetical protein [Clostridia bacterium]
MKIDQTVKRETLRIAAGTLILSTLMVAVFLVLRQFSIKVLLGALWGSFFAVLNFFLLGISVQKAAEKMNGVHLPPQEEDEETGEVKEAPLSPEAQEAKKQMHLSYSLRMLMLFAACVAGVCVPVFHPVAALLPLLFPRLVMMILRPRG